MGKLLKIPELPRPRLRDELCSAGTIEELENLRYVVLDRVLTKAAGCRDCAIAAAENEMRYNWSQTIRDVQLVRHRRLRRRGYHAISSARLPATIVADNAKDVAGLEVPVLRLGM